MSETTPEAQPQTLEDLAGQAQNGNGIATSTAPPAPAPAGDTPPDGGQVPPWERDGQPFDPERAWNRIQGMQRDLEAARSRVTEYEQAAMTDQQRLEARAAEAERIANESQRELARHRVAAAKGVPAELLAGTTEDEMAAHADQLINFRGQQTSPVPSFDGGQRLPSEGMDMNTEIRRRFRG